MRNEIVFNCIIRGTTLLQKIHGFLIKHFPLCKAIFFCFFSLEKQRVSVEKFLGAESPICTSDILMEFSGQCFCVPAHHSSDSFLQFALIYIFLENDMDKDTLT